MSETDISKEIRDSIRAAGFKCERLQSGKVKVNGGWMHLCTAGTPDLLVLKPYSFLETKTPIGKLSAEQKEFFAWAKTNGINVEVVRSKEEALAFVKEWDACKAN